MLTFCQWRFSSIEKSVFCLEKTFCVFCCPCVVSDAGDVLWTVPVIVPALGSGPFFPKGEQNPTNGQRCSFVQKGNQVPRRFVLFRSCVVMRTGFWIHIMGHFAHFEWVLRCWILPVHVFLSKVSADLTNVEMCNDMSKFKGVMEPAIWDDNTEQNSRRGHSFCSSVTWIRYEQKEQLRRYS